MGGVQNKKGLGWQGFDDVMWVGISIIFYALPTPATETRLMQYLFPALSGRL